MTQPPEETGSTFLTTTSVAQARSVQRGYRVLLDGPDCGAGSARLSTILLVDIGHLGRARARGDH